MTKNQEIPYTQIQNYDIIRIKPILLNNLKYPLNQISNLYNLNYWLIEKAMNIKIKETI